MRLDYDLPFDGEVVWLTPEQGGRSSGPPLTPDGQDYASTAYIPPATVHTDFASFIIRAVDRTAWRSAASAAWLVVENEGAYRVADGTVLVVTEGACDVAHFHVHRVART